MTLKQGFGRLIRTQQDAGVVAILDRRIVPQGYGRALLAGLPPAGACERSTSCAAFWAELDASPERPSACLSPRRIRLVLEPPES